MRLSKKELLFLRNVTSDSTLSGSFDFENYSDEEFEKFYGLTKKEVDKYAATLNKKVIKALDKFEDF